MDDLSVCAIFQNEASYLKEWIEFHQLVGVQHFFLYDNASTDSFLTVLDPYLTRGEVTLTPWNAVSTAHPEWDLIQRQAYADALHVARDKTRWLAFIDIDEFLFPVEDETLPAFLSGYQDFAGVCVNWQLYGTSKVATIPKDQLLIETLVMKAPANHEENFQVKSIVQPSLALLCKNPHVFTYAPGFTQVDARKQPFYGPRSGQISVDQVRINHYWSKDEAHFFKVKAPRRKKWGESAEAMMARLKILNQVEDKTIFRFVPRLKKKMGMI